jgi:hypothetical protein
VVVTLQRQTTTRLAKQRAKKKKNQLISEQETKLFFVRYTRIENQKN